MTGVQTCALPILFGAVNKNYEETQKDYQENPWDFDMGQIENLERMQRAGYVLMGLTTVAAIVTVVSIPFTRWKTEEKVAKLKLGIKPCLGGLNGIVLEGGF